MFDLDGTPYDLDQIATAQVNERLRTIEDRMSTLRSTGTLTDETLRDYYGAKRFEQVAESNAIEGSTLSVGETELAVAKGITLTGHDPAFVRDAIALDKALTRIAELARDRERPTDINQLHEVHSLLLGERPGAGLFRQERVTIRGSKHVPPKTWVEIMNQMENWQNWSVRNKTLPAPIRSAVLHAWLTHIHPYIDGNGRVSRAIGNLELIRAGYPPIIIKKKERERYIESLGESDQAGDIRSFMELVFDRVEGALVGLELSAKLKQDFHPAIKKIRLQQEKQLRIWETTVKLLGTIIEHNISGLLEDVRGTCSVHIFSEPLDLEDYLELCAGRAVPKSWAFIVNVEIPGMLRIEKLAYNGHRSARMHQQLGREGGPALYWSRKNPSGFPRWKSDENAPFALELTTHSGNGDEWYVRHADDSFERIQTTKLAMKIANAIVDQVQIES